MDLTNIRLEREQHGAIVGRTGTGKSYLAKRLIDFNAKKLAIIDPKGDFDVPDNIEIFHSARMVRFWKPKRFVYRPKRREFGNMADLDGVFDHIFTHAPFDVYIDDLFGIISFNRYPASMRECYMLGRSRGIRMLAAFQRPATLPLFMLSESRKFYAFAVNINDDVKRLAAFIPSYNPKELTNVHDFAYFAIQSGVEQAQKMRLVKSR